MSIKLPPIDIVFGPEIFKSCLLLFLLRCVIAFSHQLLVEVVYIITMSRSIPCDQDQRRDGKSRSISLPLTAPLRPKLTSWWTNLVFSIGRLGTTHGTSGPPDTASRYHTEDVWPTLYYTYSVITNIQNDKNDQNDVIRITVLTVHISSNLK